MLKQMITAAVGIFISQHAALADGPGSNVPYATKASFVARDGPTWQHQVNLHNSHSNTDLMSPAPVHAADSQRVNGYGPDGTWMMSLAPADARQGQVALHDSTLIMTPTGAPKQGPDAAAII